MRNQFLQTMVFLLLIINGCKKAPPKDDSSKKTIATTFTYEPAKPVEGKLYGVVELGAAGFNSFIIEADKDLNWKLNHREYGTSLLVEGMTNTMLVNQKLKEYLESIKKHGLPDENIYFVVSSGAMKEDITKVIVQELENLGHTSEIVTPEEEGLFALKAILPKEFEQNSFVVDIGSGNTKITYIDVDGNKVSNETFGAKYYQKGIEDEEVYNKVKETAAKVPKQRRTYCFYIGGVPTYMAKHLNENLKQFNVLSPDSKAYDDIKGKKAKSGVTIFKAIQDETNVKQSLYYLDGNFTVGFLLDKIASKE